MAYERPAKAKTQPEGEWAVFHERPFPARLDRALHGVAIALAATGAASGVWYALTVAAPWWMVGTAAVIAAALVYGLARPIGILVAEAYRMTRPKAYAVDWHQEPTLRQRRLKGAAFAAALVALLILFGLLDRFA